MGKAGNVCMLLGTALVLAALSLFLWNQREAAEAGRAAEAVLPRLVENMEAARTKPTTPDATLPDPYDPEMTVVEIDGYGYVGVLTIPALELELPVMSEWDAARLKIAPCRYSGSTKTRELLRRLGAGQHQKLRPAIPTPGQAKQAQVIIDPAAVHSAGHGAAVIGGELHGHLQ